MEFQDRNAGEEEFSQAIIENLFLLKDGSVVMGCHVVVRYGAPRRIVSIM